MLFPLLCIPFFTPDFAFFLRPTEEDQANEEFEMQVGIQAEFTIVKNFDFACVLVHI